MYGNVANPTKPYSTVDYIIIPYHTVPDPSLGPYVGTFLR